MFKVRSLQEKSELLDQLKAMYFVGIVIFVDTYTNILTRQLSRVYNFLVFIDKM